ncbi:MAG: UDP-3-O-(3-hydroxymyristoyl)glucosamine N-acyltransferase [Gammaproteobacteria bacterium]|nr:UDP-3-O-(3-hydroxymyristoyl)glucosamine N-acyltransferase [Gammaproteobacteria bacterium]NNJ48996.1 UDP-3-O-(3-hydroxymyristoyl)glucosamine N-acyltransferase [Gammaproteobacteria bacterium]
MAIKLSELAEETGCRLHGDDCYIENVSDLDAAREGDLAFIYHPKYLDKIDSTNASAIILKENWLDKCPKPALVADNPRLAFVKATRLLNPERRYEAGISKSADIASGVEVPASAYIGPNVVIESAVKLGEGVQIGANSVLCMGVNIGENSVIHPNVSIGHNTEIGSRCIIYAGTVIGADGFGYERDGDSYLKIPQLGNVRIGDDVEIGANTAVDRGALRDTVINDGVKLDNLVQIAHNVVVGKHTLMSGHSGIAGSTRVGEYCLIGGGVGISDNIEVCDNVVIMGRTLVAGSITKPGTYASSMLTDEVKNWRKNALRFKHLNEMEKRLKSLEKKAESEK